MKKVKLRLNRKEDVVCPYKEGKTCKHPRCIRMRLQECVYYHNAEVMTGAQVTVKIVNNNTRAKEKYLRRIRYASN